MKYLMSALVILFFLVLCSQVEIRSIKGGWEECLDINTFINITRHI